MEYIKIEFKRLTPICIFLFLIGLINSIGLGLALAGLYLLAEHMYSYGRWDAFDILGHETFGIVLLVTGLNLIGNYASAIISLITYLIFSNRKWDKNISPFEYLKAKLGII